jgi:hypothetical protein
MKIKLGGEERTSPHHGKSPEKVGKMLEGIQ